MAGKTTYFKIGLFAIVWTLLLVGGIVVFGLKPSCFREIRVFDWAY